MESVKLKIFEYLLILNIKIGKRLAFYHAKYSATEEVEQIISKKRRFDLSKMADRFKHIWIHDEEVLNKRWDTCQDCEHLFKATNQCKKCGCFMDVKHRLATTACPIGKWDKEYEFIKGIPVNGTHTTS